MIAKLLPSLYLTAGVIALSILGVAYANISFRRVNPDDLGRVQITPGPLSIIFGLFSGVLFVLFGYSTLETNWTAKFDIFWLLVGSPLTALMGWGVYVIFWARLRAGPDGVAFRGLRGWQFTKWDDIVGVNTSSGLSPRIQFKTGRSHFFWPYGYRLTEIRDMFVARGKAFEIE